MYVYARLKYYQTFPSIIRNILTDQNVCSMYDYTRLKY